jgi:hypothetical protein
MQGLVSVPLPVQAPEILLVPRIQRRVRLSTPFLEHNWVQFSNDDFTFGTVSFGFNASSIICI